MWTSLSHNDQNIEFQLKTIFRITNDAALPFQPLNMDRIMEGIPRQINNKVSQDSEGDDFDKKRKLFTDTAGSKIFLKYDPLFLTRFSFSNVSRMINLLLDCNLIIFIRVVENCLKNLKVFNGKK